MASINVTTGSNGVNPLAGMYYPLVLGARTIDKGQMQVIQSQMNTVEVSRFSVALDKLEAPVATPVTANDSMTKDFVQIETGDFMFYDTFNSLRDFQEDWSYLWKPGQREADN